MSKLIWLQFVCSGPTDNNRALVQIMACRLIGVTRPQWVQIPLQSRWDMNVCDVTYFLIIDNYRKRCEPIHWNTTRYNVPLCFSKHEGSKPVLIDHTWVRCLSITTWIGWHMIFGLEQEGASLIAPMALAHRLHPIDNRSSNRRRNLWVGWCISSWWPLFPSRRSVLIYIYIYMLFYMSSVFFGLPIVSCFLIIV